MKRLVAEASAIIVSILIAFAIDAWWEEHQERASESELLGRLHAEFSSNLVRIDARSYYATILVRGEELFATIAEALDDNKETIEVSGLALKMFTFAPTYEADTPVLDGLIRSGRLEIIEDRKIQLVLATWERQLRDYTALAERARRNVDEFLLPALYRRADVGELIMIPLRSENMSAPAVTRPVRIQIDDEFKGIIAGRYAYGLGAQAKFEELRIAAQDVIDAIDANLQ